MFQSTSSLYFTLNKEHFQQIPKQKSISVFSIVINDISFFLPIEQISVFAPFLVQIFSKGQNSFQINNSLKQNITPEAIRLFFVEILSLFDDKDKIEINSSNRQVCKFFGKQFQNFYLNLASNRAKLNEIAYFELNLSILADSFRFGYLKSNCWLTYKNYKISALKTFLSILSEEVSQQLHERPNEIIFPIAINSLYDDSIIVQTLEQIVSLSFGSNLKIDSENVQILFLVSDKLKIKSLKNLCKIIINPENIIKTSAKETNHFDNQINSDQISTLVSKHSNDCCSSQMNSNNFSLSLSDKNISKQSYAIENLKSIHIIPENSSIIQHQPQLSLSSSHTFHVSNYTQHKTYSSIEELFMNHSQSSQLKLFHSNSQGFNASIFNLCEHSDHSLDFQSDTRSINSKISEEIHQVEQIISPAKIIPCLFSPNQIKDESINIENTINQLFSEYLHDQI
jgi:hypothetical protein